MFQQASRSHSLPVTGRGQPVAMDFLRFLANATPAQVKHVMDLARKSSKLILLLDIDQTSFLGEDTNDLLRAIFHLFWKQLEDRSKEPALLEVGRLLVNPRLVEAFREITKEIADVHVMLYTNKGTIQPRMREWGVPVPSITAETMRFQEGRVEEGYQYICGQLPLGNNVKAKHEFGRLGLVSWAVADTLGLGYLPSVLVNATPFKNLPQMSTVLEVGEDKMFLFDDKAVQHQTLFAAATGQGRDYVDKHILPVDKFNFTSIGAKQAESLKAVLDENFPLKGLKRKCFPLYQQIVLDPTWPEENRCITRDEQWVVRHAHVMTWEERMLCPRDENGELPVPLERTDEEEEDKLQPWPVRSVLQELAAGDEPSGGTSRSLTF